MKILIVSTFFSESMGYTENVLPKALASLGHEVHLVTSNLNVYGNESSYVDTYEKFLGPADQGIKKYKINGFTVHRLPSKIIKSYVLIWGLLNKVKEISPDIVHSIEIASLQTYILAFGKPFFRFKLYTETHQHLSVVKPFLLEKGNIFKKIVYYLTRTMPTALASYSVVKCYAIAPDCAIVANEYYGVPNSKIIIQGLGTDTDLFSPPKTDLLRQKRNEMRSHFGIKETDIVCIYTGRFTETKNPLCLAKAITRLNKEGLSFYGLFIGNGPQSLEIRSNVNTNIISFVKNSELADYYRIADVAVWPTQESMSMLDAASSGLPLVVSNKIGERIRIEGNGLFYEENSVESLVNELKKLLNKNLREELGRIGRDKMLNNYSLKNLAVSLIQDYAKD